ncbi:type IV secretory system conjugative DNA transfer family protein [Flavihumibacter sp. RY-1]|uniref:Type IV secretory system conjugative DNA transfer family protein n=1 Tax=Flavihumibacter fluminis TaxID=2909236 RepID=A0ABS9BI49_9BACT|nr:type IV secretory system conjugative DNA transfer family protein [Flavihumibacter fluminis]MCF1715386.1 type IV secretory system conjugative DNA transfer family protein [Flavihumibacter fluminis]
MANGRNIANIILGIIGGIFGLIMLSLAGTSYSLYKDMGEFSFLGSALLYFFLFLLTLFLLYLRFKKRPKIQQPVKNTSRGSAEWSNYDAVKASGNGIQDHGLWLGNFYRRQKFGNLLTVAGAGSGKNACIIIPNLLVVPFGSYVVTDPKGENAYITARHQKQMHQKVYILDPWEQQEKMQAKHGIPTATFNPFDFIRSEPNELRDNCELLAYYLIPLNTEAKDPYWDNKARSIIKTFLMYIMTSLPEEEQNFWTLYKLLRLQGDDWTLLMAKMNISKELDGLVAAAAGEFSGFDRNSDHFASILSGAHNATTIFESPQLRASLNKSGFNPYELANGNVTLYIVIPEKYMETHSAWLRLVIGLCLKAVNARPNKRVNFILDEFAVLGKMTDVLRAYAFGRGQNIVMWAFAQSLSQIKQIYGEDGLNTLLSNTNVLQAFGVKDKFTKDYVSYSLGTGTLSEVKVSNSHSQNGSSTSKSVEHIGRPLLDPDEVERFQDIITIADGLRFPIEKVGYYQNRYENRKWDDPRTIPDFQKMMKKGQIPDDLRELFKDRADPPPRIIS